MSVQARVLSTALTLRDGRRPVIDPNRGTAVAANRTIEVPVVVEGRVVVGVRQSYSDEQETERCGGQ